MHRWRSGWLGSWIRPLGITFLMVSPGQSEDETTIRITNGEWTPYLGEHLPDHGIASALITESFKEAGIKVHYGFFPWTRALRLAQGGEWDAAAVWFKTPERETHFYFSVPVIQSTYTFFHLKETPFEWKTFDDLQGLRIGGTQSYAYGEAFSAADKAGLITVDWATDDETNFRKLLGGRIQAFPVDRIVGYAMIAKLFPPEVAARFTDHPLPLKSDSLHLLFSKKVPKNVERVGLFNQGLARLKHSGRYEELLQRAAPKP